MPFEAITCTHCGSGDVKEVKPGTYFCDHCEQVFKYVDPAKVTVTPGFCDHGNPVRVQCQVCKAGMCVQQCDVVAAWAADKSAGVVRTQGFGYLEQDWGYHVDVEGPFLPVGKLLASLARDRGGLSHACYACVLGAVPAAAERIASGEICQTIRCGSAAAGKCPCCNAGFCRDCSIPLVASHREVDRILRLRGIPSGPGSVVILAVRGGQIDMHILDGDPGRAYQAHYHAWRAPDGMCKPCAGEHAVKALAMAEATCRQDYAGRLDPSDHGFEVPAVQVRRKRQLEEIGRQHQVAQQYAAEISAHVAERMVIEGNCDLAQRGGAGGAGDVNYAIMDDRHAARPAALSGVIWARPHPLAMNRLARSSSRGGEEHASRAGPGTPTVVGCVIRYRL
ncbi:MAG TPA: hypothetical protein VMU95_35125 [Trebonia sp.]|nr:hypothetical protein [Trebonia sp.]